MTTAAAMIQNGMLRFNIAGFGYSAPSIRIKMTRTAVGATSKIQPKKTAIACVKGKEIKKVVGLNPKCPVGYKKK